ncbi:hypothetical protein PR048_017233 [Dryococelus australis]|uniref:Uncharacterized protein n=1 Tax=Dryococelus australis TaxID=614101 RepID=A0ABQ9H9K6_9NEOP|nr:hypothetical protein PR048_017233 [Dryococelus australis]
MCTNKDATLVAGAAGMTIAECEVHRPRQFWVVQACEVELDMEDLMKDSILDDVDEFNLEYKCGGGFRNCFRMTSSDFGFLLTLTAPRISKDDTSFRRAIPVCEHLAVTLRFLVTGDSYHSLMYLFKTSNVKNHSTCLCCSC